MNPNKMTIEALRELVKQQAEQIKQQHERIRYFENRNTELATENMNLIERGSKMKAKKQKGQIVLKNREGSIWIIQGNFPTQKELVTLVYYGIEIVSLKEYMKDVDIVNLETIKRDRAKGILR